LLGSEQWLLSGDICLTEGRGAAQKADFGPRLGEKGSKKDSSKRAAIQGKEEKRLAGEGVSPPNERKTREFPLTNAGGGILEGKVGEDEKMSSVEGSPRLSHPN